MNFGSHFYKLDLRFGGIDFNYSKNVRKINISNDLNNILTFIQIFIDVSRSAFDQDILPNRDKVTLTIKKVSSSDYKFETGQMQEIFKKELIILEELELDNVFEKNPKDIMHVNSYILNCVTKENLKNYFQNVVNKIYYQVTKEKIINDVPNIKLVSNLRNEKDVIIEQFFIPPISSHKASKYISRSLGLFSEPLINRYNLIDNKLHVGSCVKNKYEPIVIKYVTSVNNENKKGYQNNISGVDSDEKIDFVTFNPIKQVKENFSNILLYGPKFKYTYFPYDTLWYKKDKEYKNNFYKKEKDIIMNTGYGKSDIVKNQLKSFDNKIFYYFRNQYFLLENANDSEHCNDGIDKQYISSKFNKIIKIDITTSWNFNLEKICNIGSKIELYSDIRKIYNKGEYFLKESNLTLIRHQSQQKDLFVYQPIIQLIAYSGVSPYD